MLAVCAYAVNDFVSPSNGRGGHVAVQAPEQVDECGSREREFAKTH